MFDAVSQKLDIPMGKGEQIPMKAAITMWKNKRMIILAAVCAVIYGGARALLMIDFPLLAPEVVGMGVANLLPMLFGLLFGPAGAWGVAIGHLAGDLGALTWRSLFESVSIFLLGYLPYTMWTTLKPIADGRREPSAKNWRSWALMYSHRAHLFGCRHLGSHYIT